MVDKGLEIIVAKLGFIVKRMSLAASSGQSNHIGTVFNLLKNETRVYPKHSKPQKRIIVSLDREYRDKLLNMIFQQA